MNNFSSLTDQVLTTNRFPIKKTSRQVRDLGTIPCHTAQEESCETILHSREESKDTIFGSTTRLKNDKDEFTLQNLDTLTVFQQSSFNEMEENQGKKKNDRIINKMKSRKMTKENISNKDHQGVQTHEVLSENINQSAPIPLSPKNFRSFCSFEGRLLKFSYI